MFVISILPCRTCKRRVSRARIRGPQKKERKYIIYNNRYGSPDGAAQVINVMRVTRPHDGTPYSKCMQVPTRLYVVFIPQCHHFSVPTRDMICTTRFIVIHRRLNRRVRTRVSCDDRKKTSSRFYILTCRLPRVFFFVYHHKRYEY